jgi:plastocyanin
MKRAALLAVGVLASVAMVAAPAEAATTSVPIQNFGFSPRTVTVVQGGTVQWTQQDPGIEHTTTSSQGFWHSAVLETGQTYSQTAAFRNAGSYPYHCSIHTEMTGAVRVPMKFSGAPATGWRLRWSSLTSTPSTRSFDVQIKRPGTTSWAAFRTNTAVRTLFFNPTHNGTYAFRARTRNLSNGTASGWSPVGQVRVS